MSVMLTRPITISYNVYISDFFPSPSNEAVKKDCEYYVHIVRHLYHA